MGYHVIVQGFSGMLYAVRHINRDQTSRLELHNQLKPRSRLTERRDDTFSNNLGRNIDEGNSVLGAA